MNTTIYRSQTEQPFKTVAPGVELCVLRQHAAASGNANSLEGSTLIFRMAKGARAPLHDHPGGEETYFISGRLRIGERVLLPGDYLWTAPGESHDAIAEDESLFFVVLPGGLRVGNSAAE